MRVQTVQQAFFITLVALVSLAFLALLQDFLQPLFWAAVLAILFRPAYRRVLRAFEGRAALASVTTLLVILLAVILPLFFVGLAVSREAAEFYERIATGEIDLQEQIQMLERAVPPVRAFMDRWGIEVERLRQGVSGAAVRISQFLASQALVIGQNALRFGLLFFLMLYLLFFFLRDGDRLIEAVVRALPLGDERERRLLTRFAEAARATIKGTLVVGLVQGTLGGLLFWVLGIQAAVFWGVIMTLLSLLPAVGSVLVWGPAALILLAFGEVVKGIILLVIGTLIIGLVDNVLRPVLVGRDTQMPDYMVLLSTLGGLTVFGLSGFVIGPVIAALFLSVWEMFEREYGEDGAAAFVSPAAPEEEKEEWTE